MQENDPDFEAASFGLEVEKFLHTPLGRYLLERAKREIDEARISLGEASPTDAEAIRSLQNDIKVAQNFGIWLREAIEDGIVAESRIRDQDAEATY